MHIVEKDGIKCVAYVRAFLRVYVDYYEYRNPLITGDEVLFTDYFGKGGFDPFVDGYEYDSNLIGYYEKHEYRNSETMKPYDLW